MGLSNKFDSNIYIEPDGSKWVRICHHNNPYTNGIFAHHSDAEWNAGVYGTEHKWFDLGILNDISGTWELMVKQASTSGGTEQKWRWTQNYNPNTTTTWATAQPGTVTINTSSGYQPSSMGGLYRMNSNARMCIANTSSSNWYGAFGSWTPYGTGKVPAYPNTEIQTGYMDLYVRVDALLDESERSLVYHLPCLGNLNNKGSAGSVIIPTTGTEANSAGKIGQCIKLTTTKVPLGYSSKQVNTGSISFGGWFKFSKSEIWSKISSLSYTSTNKQFIYSPLGNNSYGGLSLAIYSNNIYSDGALNSFGASGYLRSATAGACATSSYSVPFDTWTHLMVVYDKSAGKMRLFVNGVQYGNDANIPSFSDMKDESLCFNYSGIPGGNGVSTQIPYYINDIRIYNYALSAKEVKELSKCLVLHYKLSGAYGSGDNLGNTSADYHNKADGLTENCSAWGGDAGTVTWHRSGGYNNLPYKVYHKTATGTGGIYAFPACDITLKASTTYTMSVYVKASRDFSDSHYSFNVNRRSDNHYITNGSSVHYTTDWTRVVKTFTTSSSEAGEYCEMSIIYDDAVTDYYVYYSGFKIEEGSVATEWSPPINSSDLTVYDASGYGYNGYIQSGRNMSTTGDTARYSASTMFPLTSSQTGNYITMDNASFFSALSNCTITWWGKYKAAKSLLLTGQTTSHYLAAGNASFYNGTCTLTKWYTDGLPQGTPSYVADQWHFYAFTGTLNSWTKLMLNNYGGGDTWSINGQISDFRIYNSTLSDADILELYQTSASIDKNGNYFTRELVE